MYFAKCQVEHTVHIHHEHHRWL